ncbi:hypothetical protein N7533_008944 [Penicillium manginii]|uniref:uncharacterized protein n=1 Tax=Penicillium manginii TaxID=203109 RepID=UPI002549AC4E|nr:uncharacterized protein N7533_008944 [Penicillium manginii]KAJ5744074.1 hypothetical protein N7533_008944 [Penicillium manginii]
MFSCIYEEPRKAAFEAIKQSNILTHCPNGILLGHWKYPPHLKNVELLMLTSSRSLGYQINIETGPTSSSSGRTPFPMLNTNSLPGRDSKSPIPMNLRPRSLSKVDHGQQTVNSAQALQLVLRKTYTTPEHPRMATIGARVMISGKSFYFVPAHITYPEEYIRTASNSATDSQSDDDEYFFEGFDGANEGPPDTHEADFMSRYSLTPGTSSQEAEWGMSQADAASESQSDRLTPRSKDNREMDVSHRQPIQNVSTLGTRESPSLVHSFRLRVGMSYLKSETLDYSLIEIENIDESLLKLPVFSLQNIARLNSNSVDVVSATGSGNILTGVLSNRRSFIRLPSAKKYSDALQVQFKGSLQQSDSGSLVQDATTGMIYGHIAAGDTESQTAIIIPAFDVFGDMVEKSKQGLISPLPESYDVSEFSILRSSSFIPKENRSFGPESMAIDSDPSIATYIPPLTDPKVSSSPTFQHGYSQHEIGSFPSLNSGFQNLKTPPSSVDPSIQSTESQSITCGWAGCAYTGSFASKSTLWRHIQTKHVSPSEHKCRTCGRAFGRKDKLLDHLRTMHS